jgi:hypothetical protein
MKQFVEINEAYKEQLVKDWDSVINVEGLNDVKSETMKKNLAQVLENTYKSMVKEGFDARVLNEDVFTNNIGVMRGEPKNAFSPTQQDWKKGDMRIPLATIPLARRMFTQLLAHDVVGVQSMASPTGYAAAFRYVYGSGKEEGQEIIWGKFNPAFSGTEAEAYGVYSGDWVAYNNADAVNKEGDLFKVLQGSFGIGVKGEGDKAILTKASGLDVAVGENLSFNPTGTDEAIARVSMKLEKILVEAKTRKLGTSISMEEAEDCLVSLGLDVNDSMINILATDLKNSMDRELLQEIVLGCVGTKEKADKAYRSIDVSKLDGIDQIGRLSCIYTDILSASKRIQFNCKMGNGANWMITSSPMSALIERIGDWKMVENDVNIDGAAIAYAGTLRHGSIKVYNDALSSDPYVLLGWKGADVTQTGVVYCPYVLPQLLSAPDTDKFGSRLMARARYAIVNSLFGTENFYQFLHFKNISNIQAFTGDTARVFATI